MVNEDKRASREGLLEEAIDELRRLRVLIVQVMDLAEGVQYDDLWTDRLLGLCQAFGYLRRNVGNAKRWQEMPPDVFGGRRAKKALLNNLFRSVEFHIKNSRSLRRQAEKALAAANRAGNLPSQGALSGGGSTPQEGDPAPHNEGIE